MEVSRVSGEWGLEKFRSRTRRGEEEGTTDWVVCSVWVEGKIV